MAVRVGGRNDVLLPAGETSLCPRRAFGFRGRSFFHETLMAHEFQIKVMLSAEEYVALKQVCDDIGTSQSGMLRMLAKEKIRSHADSMRKGTEKATDDTGQE